MKKSFQLEVVDIQEFVAQTTHIPFDYFIIEAHILHKFIFLFHQKTTQTFSPTSNGYPYSTVCIVPTFTESQIVPIFITKHKNI